MTVSTIDPVAALVVIDLQEGILALPTVPYGSADVLARSLSLADAFRAHGLPVVRVRVTGSPAAPGRTSAAPRGPVPDGWDVLVSAEPSDIVVTKRNWGAFHGTDLDVQLRRRGVTQVVLCGIATSIGVESTARAAHEHGYHVVLAVDAMADGNPDAHQNSVERIFPRLGETGSVDEIVSLLKAR